MSPLRSHRSAGWLLDVAKTTTALRRLTIDDMHANDGSTSGGSPDYCRSTDRPSALRHDNPSRDHPDHHDSISSPVMHPTAFLERCRQTHISVRSSTARDHARSRHLLSPVKLQKPQRPSTVPAPEPQTAMQSLLHRSLNYETAFVAPPPRGAHRRDCAHLLPMLLRRCIRPYVAICVSFLLGVCASLATSLYL